MELEKESRQDVQADRASAGLVSARSQILLLDIFAIENPGYQQCPGLESLIYSIAPPLIERRGGLLFRSGTDDSADRAGAVAPAK